MEDMDMRHASLRSAVARAILAILVAAVPAAAAEVTVTSTADSGPGSLRAAIAAAQPGDTIAFGLPLPATITLTTGTLVVDKDLTIAGPGAAQLTVRRDAAAPDFTVFQVNGAVTATLAGLTIAGGGRDVRGGGVFNSGNLTLSKTVVRDNLANWGGGIWNNEAASLTVLDSAIVNNASMDTGGALVHCCDTSSLTFVRSTVAGNVSHDGVAIDISSAYYSTTPLTLRLVSSTIDGVIMNDYGFLDLIVDSSTLTTSEARPLLSNYYGYASTVRARNSILAARSGQRVLDEGFTATSLGYNIFSDGFAGVALPTDRPSTDARLGPLQNNGGPTATRALLPGSPAVDGGWCTDSDGAAVTADQRGVSRPQGASCDIGAFEVEPFRDPLVDQIAQTVAARLDVTTSSRASQASVDALAATAQAISGGVAGLLPEIRSRASQASVNTLAIGLTSIEDVIRNLSNTLPSGSVVAGLQAGVADMSTRLTAIKSSVDAMSAAAVTAARLDVERALEDGKSIVSLRLPAFAGGQLETVHQLVADCIAGLRLIGAKVSRDAAFALSRGEDAYAAGDYTTAFAWYYKAYQQLR
jgi:hypothetical protein